MSSSTRYFSIAASVSPPPAMENAGAARDRLGEHARAFAELVELEYADRPVPDDRAGVRDTCGAKLFGRVRADVQDHFVGPTLATFFTSASAFAENSFATTTSVGNGISTFEFCERSSRPFAMPIMSASTSDLPTL